MGSELIEDIRNANTRIPESQDILYDVELIAPLLPVYADNVAGLPGLLIKEIPLFPLKPGDRKLVDLPRKQKRALRIEQAFNKCITPKEFEKVATTLVEIATDKDHPQVMTAVREIMNRTLGRVPHQVQKTETVTLTLEQRKKVVLEALGVGDFIDGEALPSSDQETGSGRGGSADEGTFALPAPLPAGQEPVHPVGEESPGGSDMDMRIEKCLEEGDEEGAD